MTAIYSTRRQASQANQTRYFTGKPCVNGHVAERKTDSGSCCECAKLVCKQWHSKNKERSSEYGAAYRAVRGEDLLVKKREYQRQWNAENKPIKRQRDAEYEAAKRAVADEKFLAMCAKRTKDYETAKANRIPSWADLDAVAGMYELAQVFRKCGLNMEVDHIVPLQSELVSGFHTHDNLQLMIRNKNASKSNRYWPDQP